MASKHPTKPEFYWATFDDGNVNVEVAVVRVEYYSGLSSFEDGAVCHFADARDGDHQFAVKSFEPQVVQPPASALKQMPETVGVR